MVKTKGRITQENKKTKKKIRTLKHIVAWKIMHACIYGYICTEIKYKMFLLAKLEVKP